MCCDHVQRVQNRNVGLGNDARIKDHSGSLGIAEDAMKNYSAFQQDQRCSLPLKNSYGLIDC